MARFLFSVLAAPSLAARIQVHNEAQHFQHLSMAESEAANEALDVLAQLKENMDDVALSNKYREIIGEIEWEEDRAFLMSGENSEDPPPMLGEASEPGRTQLTLAELLSGRLASAFNTRFGRYFTGRRDFAIEDAAGGETKYTIDGFTFSLHSRMQVSFPNEEKPRYVIRRAFNYLNPVASTVGQYVYRVIQCQDEQGGWAGGCKEGEMLYTITKDRFGRGAMWAQDEYRVYTGTGGCSRHGNGVLSCRRDNQILYSISAGLTSGTHDTTFYNGHINAINGDHESGRLYDGTRLNAEDLLGMQVATVSKVTGSPRALNWPMQVSAAASDAALDVAVYRGVQTVQNAAELAESLEGVFSMETYNRLVQIQENIQAGADAMTEFQGFLDFLPVEEAEAVATTLGGAWRATQTSVRFASWASSLALVMHVAKSLVWADNYRVAFNGGGGPTDDLLISIVAAVQDLTRERVALAGAATVMR